MVQVVTTQTSTAIQSANPMGIIQWFMENAGVLLLGLFLVVACIIIFVVINKIKEERKERSEPLYQAYKEQFRDSELGAKPIKIKKSYSMANLFVLGLPIFKNENSNKIINYTNDLIGYYRGECFSMDGYYNLLVYKKKFLWMEDLFLIKCPWELKVKKFVRDEFGNKIKHKNGQYKSEIVIIPYKNNISEMPNGDIKIQCTHTEKHSFFNYPVYISENKKIIDYRSYIGEDLIELNANVMMSRVLSTGASMVEKGMMHNPDLKYRQLAPEKTKEEDFE